MLSEAEVNISRKAKRAVADDNKAEGAVEEAEQKYEKSMEEMECDFMAAAGKISEDELNFKEDVDQDIGQDPAKIVEKETAKKSSLVAAAAKKKAEDAAKEGKSAKDLKKEEKE